MAVSPSTSSAPKKRTCHTKTGQLSGVPYNNPKDKAKVDKLERMIMLRVQGHTHKEIGAIYGCTEENVVQRLKPYREEIAGLKKFQENKADVYDFAQKRLLQSITPEKIADAGLYETVKAARDLEEMARKVRGLDSVKSVSIFSLTVKAAHALPVQNVLPEPMKEVLDAEVDRVRSGIDGTGVCEAVREEGLPPVPGVWLDGRGEDGEDLLLREGNAAGGS